MSAPRLLYQGLSPAEWLHLHDQLPSPLLVALIDDHAILADVLAPALDVLEVLEWHVANAAEIFASPDTDKVARFRNALAAAGVATASKGAK